MFRKRFVKRLALAAITCCSFERRARDTDTLCGDAYSTAFEIAKGDFIPLALSVILGVYADLGALVLAILLVAMALKMHDFWNAQGEAKQPEMIGFMKNISMAGGALFLFAVAAMQDSNIGPALGSSLWSIAP